MTALSKKLGVVVLCLACCVGVTGAYFNYFQQSDLRQLVTGSLTFTLVADNETPLDAWLPGETRVFEYTVANNGQLPFEAKGYVAGSWDNSELDPMMVRVTGVQQLSGSDWISVTPEPLAIGAEFAVLAADGQSYVVLNPGDQVRLRLHLELNPEVDNAYQAAVFASSLHIAARQAVGGAEWPSAY